MCPRMDFLDLQQLDCWPNGCGSILSSDDESDRSKQHGQNRGSQTITANAPTTVTMNNISTTTIL